MREIKFRGKTVGAEKWVYGSLSLEADVPQIQGNGRNYVVIIDTVCQYSGIVDINDVKVYEGDILEGKETGDYGIVSFTAPQFTTEGISDKQICTLGDGRVNIKKLDFSKVVGNIWDNPELLTNKSK